MEENTAYLYAQRSPRKLLNMIIYAYSDTFPNIWHRILPLSFIERAPKMFPFLPGQPVDLDPAVAHCVLLAARRDHPADVARRTPARKVRALHYDSRHIQVRRRPNQYTYTTYRRSRRNVRERQLAGRKLAQRKEGKSKTEGQRRGLHG